MTKECPQCHAQCPEDQELCGECGCPLNISDLDISESENSKTDLERCQGSFKYETGNEQHDVDSIRKAAEEGNAYAQYKLGLRYEKGDGVDRDRDEAIKWFRRAAEQGLVDAQIQLEGYMIKDVTPPTITQTPSKTYEDHPCWKSWRGRMSRGEYLMFSIVILPIIAVGLYFGTLGILMILGMTGMLELVLILGLLAWIIFYFGLVFVRTCADIKRFHDMGQSGLFCVGKMIFFATMFVLVITLKGSWTKDWILKEFVTASLWLPVLCIIVEILNFVVLGCVDGTHGPNEYGPDPNGFSRGASKRGELAILAQTTKRLQELVKMKASGLISESEYKVRRSQIMRGA